ncbi:PREDICTED: ubiquitin-like-specific protease 1D [Tarenaya hassleriana]|uniref:ubiquitin-like-specific protease 1D n=1 Tax=Tarenaya hassleriana TaxID=28532 RepID=UPI00053C9137|nr:PREDICTED: ubiquitin-like-specific protease 1D [Tarenaya hassleriana]
MKKRKIDIDWVEVMRDGGGEEDQLPELEVVVTAKAPPVSVDEQMDCEQSLTDQQLDEVLERQTSLLAKMGPKLPDGGEKIRAKIERLEEEKQRRMLRRPKMDMDGCQKLMHSTSSDVFREGNMGSKDVSRSTFAAYFSKKPETDRESVKPFEKELQDLGCESWKHRPNGETPPGRSNGWRLLSRQEQLQPSEKYPSAKVMESKGNHKSKESCLKKKPKESSPYSLIDDDDDFIDHETPREGTFQESKSWSYRLRKRSTKAIIDVDEEEPQPSTIEELHVELPEGMKEDIYYPSRDDPDFVQVCRKDIECLSPQGYLTSTVMNFYIKYLQHETSSEKTFADCHFFNTYFYKKLIQAVSYKGNDKDAFFVKFRRWWKGTNLFHKAYIFIPIHEAVHWSLVIICIPDKEDYESGLIILHLDSLGIHSRKSIFDNVKRFLREEWNYLNQQGDASPSDKPIRITEAKIEVPQQKNDYDCGLFVLLFMKRFVEVAPERMKKKDLDMFDKDWFRPEEASGMRIEIRKILIDLFRIENQTDQISEQGS